MNMNPNPWDKKVVNAPFSRLRVLAVNHGRGVYLTDHEKAILRAADALEEALIAHQEAVKRTLNRVFGKEQE